MGAEPPLAFPGAFTGRWSTAPNCAGGGETWIVSGQAVRMGERTCRIEVVQPDVDRVVLKLSCNGKPRELTLAPVGESSLRVLNGAEQTLTRCQTNA